VTLLRNARWSDVDLPAVPAIFWQCEDFVLVQSLRDEKGARYEVLARFALNDK
jgi:2'-5' RNA ligase